MKIRVDRAAFGEAASWVAQAIAKNPSAVVMGGLRIVAQNDAVVLSGFDYETGHTAHVDAEVITPGEVLIGSRFLVPIASALKGREVELLLEDARLSISAGSSTYRATVMRAGDFPTMPAMPEAVGLIERDHLVEAIATVEHAASKDHLQGKFAALCFQGSDKLLTVVGTDRYRIARCSSVWANGSEFEAVVYASDVVTAAKGLRGAVTVGYKNGLFGFTDGARTVTTRALALSEKDRYPMPAIDAALSQPAVSTIEVTTQDLIDAIKRTLVLTDEHDLIGLDFGDGLISISVDAHAGDGSEEVECDGSGGDQQIRFNGSYLMQALVAAQTEKVRLCLGKPGSVARIEPVGDDLAGFAVMPRRKQ